MRRVRGRENVLAERPARIALGPWAIFAAVLAACAAQDPPYSTGTQGNGIQNAVVFPKPEAGPIIIDESCFDAGAAASCPVSFSKDIFPKMMSTGAWQCALASGCHGGTQAPKMLDSDVAGTYQNLVHYSAFTAGGAYILPCTPDPSQSGIVCNLAGACGSSMPLKTMGATTPTMADIAQITQWVQCGAPLN